MFRRALRPIFVPVIRNAAVLGLAAALFDLLAVSHGLAAPQTVTRDPQALTAIASSLKALTGGTTVNDLILQATVSYVAGSDDETGTARLTASGNQQSLLQLNLSGGTREEIRSGPAGAWIGADGTAHSMASNNCWTDASWFFPVLTLEAVSANPQVSVSYLGPDTSKGTTLLHLRVASVLSGQDPTVTALVTTLSTMGVYLDPQSFLPLVLDFNVQPDTGIIMNVLVEIRCGNFQKVSGTLVPFDIQKYLQGTLLLDFRVANVTVNSGVPSSTFTLPAVAGVTSRWRASKRPSSASTTSRATTGGAQWAKAETRKSKLENREANSAKHVIAAKAGIYSDLDFCW